MQECREPIFEHDQAPQRFGKMKYLWGNMSSIDVLQLGNNEGLNHRNDMNILFPGMRYT